LREEKFLCQTDALQLPFIPILWYNGAMTLLLILLATSFTYEYYSTPTPSTSKEEYLITYIDKSQTPLSEKANFNTAEEENFTRKTLYLF